MNNTTGINVSGCTWNVKDFGAASVNDNYALAIGAGVGYSNNTGALNGAIGLNMGDNSTKSIVDGSTLSGVENLKVNAVDNTSKTTIAGDINISNKGKVAAGGAVAYANIGDSSDKEVINAKITNAKISTADNGAIEVEALDNANMTTVGVGVGLAISDALASFHGAAAVSEVNKENVAEISNTAINQDNESGNANVTIDAESGKGSNADKISADGSSTDFDNKINTAAAVLDLNFSSNSLLNGAVGINVNKFNQSTEANFKSDSLSDKASHVGNVSMNSNSNADILGVAIGGAGGQSTLSAAGSVSYNYIDNSAKTLVEKENVKATKNFGVVAQSDDLIANYAGAIDVDVNGNGSIGVSVAYNEIKGNTDANIKNSNIEVIGSADDAIKYFNPKGNLIDNYVTKNTWTSGGLLDGRTEESKSGVVVNSSATHSISSDLATIGIRASTDKPGVGISGTVNINKIDGATNAKIESTDVAATGTDTFVNAVDYTNNGSFVGNAAVSGMVAIGVLWNENQVERETNSLVDGGSLNVKNLDVKADSQQGLSNLNIAVGASFATSNQAFAAASGDNVVRNQMEGTTTAKIENATVNHSGAVDVDAYHKDNAYATNLAVGAAIDWRARLSIWVMDSCAKILRFRLKLTIQL